MASKKPRLIVFDLGKFEKKFERALINYYYLFTVHYFHCLNNK